MSDVMFTSSPDRLMAEARRRGLIGVATEFRRSCGQAEPRGSVRCVWVCAEALCAEVASGTNLYLDLKMERETWWQREKGANCHRLVAVQRMQATTECIQHEMFGLAGTNMTI